MYSREISRTFARLSLAALAMAFGVGQANAAVLTFTNRTSFENALTSYTVFDFNSTALQQLDGTTGVDLGPLTVTQSTGGATAYIRASGATGDVNGSNFLQFFDNSGSYVPMTITLDAPVTAFGFDFKNVTSSAAYNIYLNILGTPTLVAPSNQSGFFGFISTAPLITQQVFDFADSTGSGSSGTLGLDNVTFGVAPVPVPGALMLMLSGLAAVGFAGRRYR